MESGPQTSRRGSSPSVSVQWHAAQSLQATNNQQAWRQVAPFFMWRPCESQPEEVSRAGAEKSSSRLALLLTKTTFLCRERDMSVGSPPRVYSLFTGLCLNTAALHLLFLKAESGMLLRFKISTSTQNRREMPLSLSFISVGAAYGTELYHRPTLSSLSNPDTWRSNCQ
jgi:hypothetical protein